VAIPSHGKRSNGHSMALNSSIAMRKGYPMAPFCYAGARRGDGTAAPGSALGNGAHGLRAELAQSIFAMADDLDLPPRLRSDSLELGARRARFRVARLRFRVTFATPIVLVFTTKRGRFGAAGVPPHAGGQTRGAPPHRSRR